MFDTVWPICMDVDAIESGTRIIANCLDYFSFTFI